MASSTGKAAKRFSIRGILHSTNTTPTNSASSNAAANNNNNNTTTIKDSPSTTTLVQTPTSSTHTLIPEKSRSSIDTDTTTITTTTSPPSQIHTPNIPKSCITNSIIDTDTLLPKTALEACKKAGCNFCKLLITGICSIKREDYLRDRQIMGVGVKFDVGEDGDGDGNGDGKVVLRVKAGYWHLEIARAEDGAVFEVREKGYASGGKFGRGSGLGRFMGYVEGRGYPAGFGPGSTAKRVVVVEGRGGAGAGAGAGGKYEGCFPWLATRPATAVDAGNAECLALVKRWLERCEREHGKCAERTSPGVLPKRVVDVGDASTCPRLCDFDSLEESQRVYVALSHVWGLASWKPENQPLQTKMNSVKAYRKCIPWKKLDGNYQDAITITRTLGIRYLWVDSLCIVQDDVSDWAEESVKMGQIFANAKLTIADSRGRSNNFLCRRSDVSVPFTIGRTGETFHVRRDVHHWPEMGDLLIRAWALQEHILSPRILTYEFNEITWDCRESRRCECGSSLSRSNYRNIDSARLSRPRSISPSSPYPTQIDAYNFTHLTRTQAEISTWWRNAVLPFYTLLETRHPTDRLPAISGLAAILQKRTHDTYLAGIWKSDLLSSLLWNTTWNSAYLPREVAYLAPSWSWASITLPVFHDETNTASPPLIQAYSLQDEDVRPLYPENLFGQVKPGSWLRINCPVVRMKFFGESVRDKYYTLYAPIYQCERLLVIPLPDSDSISSTSSQAQGQRPAEFKITARFDTAITTYTYDTGVDGEECGNTIARSLVVFDTLYVDQEAVVWVSILGFRVDKDSRKVVLVGLVLGAAVGCEKGEEKFERVGTFSAELQGKLVCKDGAWIVDVGKRKGKTKEGEVVEDGYTEEEMGSLEEFLKGCLDGVRRDVVVV